MACAQLPPAAAGPTAMSTVVAPAAVQRPATGWTLKGKDRRDSRKAGRATPARPASAGAQSDTSVQSAAPQTTVVGTPVDRGDCDYWIVSSRGCSGTPHVADTSACLTYFHRTSEQCLIHEPREAFLASVRPDRPVCFVLHGSYNRWRDIMVESRRIHRWLRSAAPESSLQVVFFSWPSDGNMPFLFPVDIAILGRRSAAHGTYLAGLIGQLPSEQQVSIIGHSHGARAAVAALHLMGGGTLEQGQALPGGYCPPHHLRVVLIAAAIDHDWLNPGERYGQALLIPEQVLLMRNSRDSTLALYPMRKGFGERAIGKGGLGRDDRFALGPLGTKVVELDAADFAEWHHSFADYHQHPELAAALLPYVFCQEQGMIVQPAQPGAPTSAPVSITPPTSVQRPAAPPSARPTTVETVAPETNGPKVPTEDEPRKNSVELRFEK